MLDRRPAILMALALLAACNAETPSPPPTAGSTSPEAVAAADCRRDISASDCAQAQATLVKDAAGLAPAPETSAVASPEDRAEALENDECRMQRLGLGILQRLQRDGPRPGEVVTDEELASLPGQMERIEDWVGQNCH